jgi:hypothetical protein
MVGLVVAFWLLNYMYPVKNSKYAASVRSILRPLVGSNPELEKYLSDAAGHHLYNEMPLSYLKDAGCTRFIMNT